MEYEHTQNAPLFWLLLVIGGVMTFSATMVDVLAVQITLSIAASVIVALALSFKHLRVTDEGDRLAVRFGPLPLFRRSVYYEQVEQVEQARSSWLDGWGIHMSPSGGWTWNLWGFDCVDIRFKNGGKLRLGTDDAEQLSDFLEKRIRRTV